MTFRFLIWKEEKFKECKSQHTWSAMNKMLPSQTWLFVFWFKKKENSRSLKVNSHDLQWIKCYPLKHDISFFDIKRNKFTEFKSQFTWPARNKMLPSQTWHFVFWYEKKENSRSLKVNSHYLQEIKCYPLKHDISFFGMKRRKIQEV